MPRQRNRRRCVEPLKCSLNHRVKSAPIEISANRPENRHIPRIVHSYYRSFDSSQHGNNDENHDDSLHFLMITIFHRYPFIGVYLSNTKMRFHLILPILIFGLKLQPSISFLSMDYLKRRRFYSLRFRYVDDLWIASSLL